jgi:hypothetical protein
MIFDSGMRGNFRVRCDHDGCAKVFFGRVNKDPFAFEEQTQSKVRRQGRRRGWAAVRRPDGDVVMDLCPVHAPPDPVMIESVDLLQIPA